MTEPDLPPIRVLQGGRSDSAETEHETPPSRQGQGTALEIPTPVELGRWVLRTWFEVVSAPFTINRARKLIVTLEQLPDQIGHLTNELARTNDNLERLLPDLADNVGQVTERFESLDGVVTELSGTLTNLIGAIPGARRAIRPNTNS